LSLQFILDSFEPFRVASPKERVEVLPSEHDLVRVERFEFENVGIERQLLGPGAHKLDITFFPERDQGLIILDTQSNILAGVDFFKAQATGLALNFMFFFLARDFLQ